MTDQETATATLLMLLKNITGRDYGVVPYLGRDM
jgi:hypothetical protein